MFPPPIDDILERFGVAPDTRSALYDLYRAMGNEAVDAFGSIAETIGGPELVTPDDLGAIRPMVVERFLTRYHPAWTEGRPTPSFWHPSEAEGRASGLLVPCGRLEAREGDDDLAARVYRAVRSIIGTNQPIPSGILILGKNAHFGGRSETISFDVVAEALDDARILARAEGRQHTVPGSAGETSGTLDALHGLALIWEVQPNVLKPSGRRNREAGPILRRHRNWHVSTLVFALEWLGARDLRSYVIRGAALEPAHQVNPHQRVSDVIGQLHEKTVHRVAEALGRNLVETDEEDTRRILESDVANTGLRRFIESRGARAAVWRVELAAAANRNGPGPVLDAR